MKKCYTLFFLSLFCIGYSAVQPLTAQDSGLLFHLSGDKGFEADYAAGNPVPNYLRNVEIIPDGASGSAFHCQYRQLMSYWAPGNIYAQRGTLSFYWRASTPFTETEFPIFRVGYADHSSWDMVFLRIDYNGHGFDAFVTDVNLARIRTSVKLDKLPEPDQWTHFALAWDENEGIRFYLDGKLAGQRDTTVVLDAGLDQFGPHSRIISPYQVQSAYNFVRGGDIDEIRIYDRALNTGQVAALSKNNVQEVAPLQRTMDTPQYAAEWRLRYGWNRPGDLPPVLEKGTNTVRKVQILETYDLKRWWWKANDGIRETTWPGVYNRSRIIGRNDYFQLPDWDCYSLSGQEVRFDMPDEEWNHIEFSGGADGRIWIGNTGQTPDFTRGAGHERTFYRMPRTVTGESVHFKNNVQETPIGEFDAYYVAAAVTPQGIGRLEYIFSGAGNTENDNVTDVLEYIAGRYPADESAVMVANPARVARRVNAASESKEVKGMPLVHLVIPSDYRSSAFTVVSAGSGLPQYISYGWNNIHGGLDGIEVTIPALDVQPLADGLYPMNIRVMDPIWPLRKMLDFSFSVRPGEEHTLWLDLRDRILPNNKPLYLTLAGDAGLDAAALTGMKATLVFKEWNEASEEHVTDRFTQVRDNYAMIVEERPNNRRLNKYNQFEADLTDLLRVDPHHEQGRNYWYIYNTEQPRPVYAVEETPTGVPLWAHYQLLYLTKYREFVEWQIDNRQIENGEFGGGLSDDSDFGNWMPPLALLGVIPDKIEESLSRMMEACYDQGMLTGGMSTIQTDALHTYEEGTNVIGQINLLRIGDPKEAERLMEAARSVRDHLIGTTESGHKHYRSDYFSATKIADKGVWAWSSPRQSLHMISAIYLGELYGHEESRQLVIDLADGFLAHKRVDPQTGRWTVDVEINFETDESRISGIGNASPLFWAAYRWTGDKKYLKVLTDESPETGVSRNITANMLDQAGLREKMGKDWNPQGGSPFDLHLAWQITGDKAYLEKLYYDQIQDAMVREYTNTLGSIWTDRLVLEIEEIQRARMGGMSQNRNMFFPGNVVSWRFDDGDTAEKVAILIPYTGVDKPGGTVNELHMEFFNTDSREIDAHMTGWDVLTGEWEVIYRTEVREIKRETVRFGRGETVTLTIPAGETIHVQMKLKGLGETVVGRPDLAIGREDVRVQGRRLHVTVHNLGGTASPATQIALMGENDGLLSTAEIPALESAGDLQYRLTEVVFDLPRGVNVKDLRLIIDPEDNVPEIRKTNNTLSLSGL